LKLVDYRKRAQECYERATQGGRTEDWAHFSELAQTWEKLADLHDLTQRLKSSGALLTKPALERSARLAQEAEGAGGRLN